MKSYIIKWRAKSPYITDLQSDTIFGHICWAVKYLLGEDRLEDLLRKLKEEPGLILTNGFPSGFLPKPVIPRSEALLKQVYDKLKNTHSLSEKDIYEERKKIKGIKWVKTASLIGKGVEYDWRDEVRDYYKSNLKEETLDGSGNESIKKDTVFHNSINRVTATTEKETSSLYTNVVTFTKPDYLFESYLDTSLLSFDELRSIFSFIEKSGFGKNKSTGSGRFEIVIEEMVWELNPDNNGWLNLSNMVPAENDSNRAYYDSFTKFGKVGGDYALSQSPFKFPIYIIRPGAVFISSEKPKGKLLPGVHPDNKNIVQNLYAYSLPVKIKELI